MYFQLLISALNNSAVSPSRYSSIIAFSEFRVERPADGIETRVHGSATIIPSATAKPRVVRTDELWSVAKFSDEPTIGIAHRLKVTYQGFTACNRYCTFDGTLFAIIGTSTIQPDERWSSSSVAEFFKRLFSSTLLRTRF